MTPMHAAPFEPAGIDAYPRVADWTAEAPGILATMLQRWDLRPGEAFVGGIAASVLAVTRPDGSPAVLKIGLPHVEGIWEAVGLQAFPSGLAPELLDQDAWTWSLLLAAVSPGVPLARAGLDPERAVRIGGELHARLASGAIPQSVPTLAEAMRDYANQARARIPDQAAALGALGVRVLVERALDELEELATTPAPTSLLHGDYNPGNILSSEGDEPWVVIDPKPLVGDPAYDLWPLISQIGEPYNAQDPAARLTSQLVIAAAAAGVDPVRVARWSRARTGLNVSWYLADGEPGQAAVEAGALSAWNSVVGD